MPDYYVEFEAHIDERKRPEGFPKSVFVKEQYHSIENDEQLKQIFNDRVKTIVTNPGIVVYPDNEIIDGTALKFDQRIYVPWHMITHFHGKVKLLTPASVPETPLESLDPSNPVKEEKKALTQ
jgi:hypothetical protein